MSTLHFVNELLKLAASKSHLYEEEFNAIVKQAAVPAAGTLGQIPSRNQFQSSVKPPSLSQRSRATTNISSGSARPAIPPPPTQNLTPGLGVQGSGRSGRINQYSNLPSSTIRTADGGSTSTPRSSGQGPLIGSSGARHGLKGAKWSHQTRAPATGQRDPQTGLRNNPAALGLETGANYNRNQAPAPSAADRGRAGALRLAQMNRANRRSAAPVRNRGNTAVQAGMGHAHSPRFRCFVKGTKVALPDKTFVSIEDIKKGDKVLSYRDGKYTVGKVSKTLQYPIDKVITIAKLDSVVGSPIHPILHKGKWILLRDHPDIELEQAYVDVFYHMEIDGHTLIGSDHTYVVGSHVVSGLGGGDIGRIIKILYKEEHKKKYAGRCSGLEKIALK